MDSSLFGGDQIITRFLEDLDTVFPPTNPQPTDDLAAVMYRAGQRSVVEYLQTLSEA